ncbi:hypothetical protein [Tateyamaria sp. ANG-S1]|uniref:hypothetical protein n=1 Tax=Tateyamaria sp. ANG-S1 TaxID=1577905 RepID=UPI00057C8A59|nr:hypothetical protein [Tateyamaria sp. ANG-S1]KIC49676.1 hypothetical protein RA29_08400 [Tateyamaria sp. ANG-S1]
MTNAFKLISAAALVAASSTAVLAQDVPVNSTVSGGQGAEIQIGQGEAGALAITPVAAAAVFAIGLAIAAGGSSSSTTTTGPSN